MRCQVCKVRLLVGQYLISRASTCILYLTKYILKIDYTPYYSLYGFIPGFAINHLPINQSPTPTPPRMVPTSGLTMLHRAPISSDHRSMLTESHSFALKCHQSATQAIDICAYRTATLRTRQCRDQASQHARADREFCSTREPRWSLRLRCPDCGYCLPRYFGEGDVGHTRGHEADERHALRDDAHEKELYRSDQRSQGDVRYAGVRYADVELNAAGGLRSTSRSQSSLWNNYSLIFTHAQVLLANHIKLDVEGFHLYQEQSMHHY
jgi:hypothetical protein